MLRSARSPHARAAALRFSHRGAGEAAVKAGPDDVVAAGMAGRGHLRASRADHERVIDAVKTAFVQGRLSKDELDERVGQTLGARTYAELAAVTADIPVGQAAGLPPARPSRAGARWPLMMSVLAVLVLAPVALLGGKTGHSARMSTSADARACQAFNAWAGPSDNGAWLLDAAVSAARRGSDANLLADLETLRHLVGQSGDPAGQWRPGPGQDPAQDLAGIASVAVSADCMLYP